MTRFELARWTRSRRLLVLLAVFTFSGVTSPLSSAFAEEIFSALATADNIQITIQEPNWRDGVESYLQNSSQLALAFACYLAAWGCSLGPRQRLRIYYRSRAERSSEVFGPRLVVTGCVVLVAVSLGAAIALYEVLVLFDDVAVAMVVEVLVVQAAGLCIVALLAACVGVVTNSPGMATAVVYGTVFVADIFGSAGVVQDWSPTVLVRPTPVLDEGGASAVAQPLIVGLGLLGLAVTVVLSRRLTSKVLPVHANTSVSADIPAPAVDGRGREMTTTVPPGDGMVTKPYSPDRRPT